MNNRAQNQFTLLDNTVSPMTGEKFHDIIFVDGSAGSCTYILPVEDEINIKNGHMITFIEERGTIDPTNTCSIQQNSSTLYPIIDQPNVKILYSPFTYSLTYLNKIWWPTHLLTTTRFVTIPLHWSVDGGNISTTVNRIPVVVGREYHGWYIQDVSYTLGTAGTGAGSNDVQLNLNNATPVAASAASMGAGILKAEAIAVRQQVSQFDRIHLQVTAVTATTPGQSFHAVLTLSQV